MTNDKMRRAVAEAVGFIDVKMRPHPAAWDIEVLSGIMPLKDYVMPIPNYPEDLNAMHEAENVLDYTQKRMMAHRIREMHNSGEYDINPNALFAIYHATPKQRCEAFLRTLEKWTEV